MSGAWASSVNQVVGSATISNISDYVEQHTSEEASPIDLFYFMSRELLKVANPDFLDGHPTIGPLLVVGIVSATENYFRDIFARILRICPVSQATSYEQSVHLGSVIWHGPTGAERGAFEHLSFAGATHVKSACKKFLGYDIKESSAVSGILKEFDKVCELRHGIVHSSLFLPGKNAVKLQIGSVGSVLKITAGFSQIQECALICTNLVAAFNTQLFEEIAKRWAVEWRNYPSWSTVDRDAAFGDVWRSFYSATDKADGLLAHALTMEACRVAVVDEYE